MSRRKHKLIIDRRIKVSSQAMRAGAGNVDVELRCERGGDIISTVVPAAVLLRRAAHAGTAARSNLGHALARAFTRSMDVVNDDGAVEQALTARQRRSIFLTRASLVVEPASSPEARLPRETQHETPADVRRAPDVESSFPPTQIAVASPQKRSGGPDHSSKRIRRIAFQSYSVKRRLEINQDTNKQNVPEYYQRLTQMLEAEGLADRDVERAQPREREKSERGRGSQHSETPLGSLDRTKVSLGESVRTTESWSFIKEEWGTRGTMYKIFRLVRSADGPVRVHSLLARGPLLPGHSRFIVASCFFSILKLQHHGFIEVTKDTETNEILDIQLGKKVTCQ